MNRNASPAVRGGAALIVILLLSMAWALTIEVEGTPPHYVMLTCVMMGLAIRLLPHYSLPRGEEAPAQSWPHIKDFIDEENLARELAAARRHLIQEEEEEW